MPEVLPTDSHTPPAVCGYPFDCALSNCRRCTSPTPSPPPRSRTEAQLDRFMFIVMVNYPKREEELTDYSGRRGAGAFQGPVQLKPTLRNCNP
jgi:MoxR-like ATPase